MVATSCCWVFSFLHLSLGSDHLLQRDDSCWADEVREDAYECRGPSHALMQKDATRVSRSEKKLLEDVLPSRLSQTMEPAASRAELFSVKNSALVKRAVAAGVAEKAIDDALDADDIKIALVDLIMAVEAYPESDTIASMNAVSAANATDLATNTPLATNSLIAEVARGPLRDYDFDKDGKSSDDPYRDRDDFGKDDVHDGNGDRSNSLLNQPKSTQPVVSKRAASEGTNRRRWWPEVRTGAVALVTFIIVVVCGITTWIWHHYMVVFWVEAKKKNGKEFQEKCKIKSMADMRGVMNTESEDPTETDTEDFSVEDTKEDLNVYLKREYASPMLGLRVLQSLAKVWSFLGLLYWSLFWKSEELMECFYHEHGLYVTHLCTFTSACLRGFPLVAVNLTIILMIKNLLQRRVYYCMLSLGYIVRFAEVNIFKEIVPWLLVFSMGMGGLHLVVEMIYEGGGFTTYATLLRSFVIPAGLFIQFFFDRAPIQNTLMPLNRFIERDYPQKGKVGDRSRRYQHLGKLQDLDEHVLAFQARHFDIVGDTPDAPGNKDGKKALAAVMNYIIQTYDKASERYDKKRDQYHEVKGLRALFKMKWGFFKSMWPANVLCDPRLDWDDKETREWKLVFNTLLVLSFVMYIFSVCFFAHSIWRNIQIRNDVLAKRGDVVMGITGIWIAIVVLVLHFLAVFIFLYRTFSSMYHYDSGWVWGFGLVRMVSPTGSPPGSGSMMEHAAIPEAGR